MPGFFITNTAKSPELKNYDDSRCFKGELKYENWNIKWNALAKFEDDKIFNENEKYIILLDGVILNKLDLIKQYNQNDWWETVLQLISNGEDFFNLLRGVFAGAIYDKKHKTWKIFTDQIGNHIALHYENNGMIAFGTQLNYFSDWMTLNHIKKELSDKWKNDMLEYGYMRDVHTIIEGVDRVFPGSFVLVDEHGYYTEKEYYVIEKGDTNYPENDIINKLDDVFHNAVLRIINKCKEYGYKYLVDLSGGLDSRMIAQIASAIDNNNSVGINYAQMGSLDQILAFEVANKLRMNCLIHPMNRGRSLENIDDFVLMNHGLNYFAGITGGKMMLEALDRDTFGIELWGALGDIYEGAMITENDLTEIRWDYPRFRTSRVFEVNHSYGYSRKYYDNEMLWFYVRGMFAGENTAFVRQNYMEGMTPYGDVEFMNLIYSISYSQRTKDHIYRKWMIKKYPEMAKIPYSHTGVRVTSTDEETERLRILIRVKNKIIRLFAPNKIESVSSMNPIDYWLKTEKILRSTWDAYYNENLWMVEFDNELYSATKKLYNSENALDKIVALTIVSAVKQYIFTS